MAVTTEFPSGGKVRASRLNASSIPVVAATTDVAVPFTGQIIFCTADNLLYRYNGSAWESFLAAGGTTSGTRHDARYLQVSGSEQTLNNATDTKLRFPTANTTCSDVTASGTGNTDFTVNRAGLLFVSTGMTFLANAEGGKRQLTLQTGSTISVSNWFARNTAPNVGADDVSLYCANIIRVTAGTVICAIGWQNRGGTLSTDGFFGNSNHITFPGCGPERECAVTRPIEPAPVDPGTPAPRGTDLAVICRTRLVSVWQGDEAVELDGQVLLTTYADSVPGPACPSKVEGCLHKAAALAEKAKDRPATLKDLDEVHKRLAKLEPKVKP